MDNINAPQAIEAILTLLPLDTFVDDFAARMQVVGAPDEIMPVQAEVQDVINTSEGRARMMQGVERFAFYDLASQAFAVVQTGETRLYGCFMLRKGVIGPKVAA
jgi:L-fucose mutarotase